MHSSNSNFLYNLKIIGEVFSAFIYFPLWWYSRGLLDFIKSNFNFLNNKRKSLAFFVWVKNIGKPMYNQTDFVGRMVSLFIRIVQIIGRGVMMLFWLFVVIVMISLWLTLPLVIIFNLFFQFGVLG